MLTDASNERLPRLVEWVIYRVLLVLALRRVADVAAYKLLLTVVRSRARRDARSERTASVA